jgi:cell division protein FtsI (penicillin-binding protein 3)
MLAFRTIGLARDSNKVGLELTYDSLLKGRNGKQLVRSIAGGVGVPVDDNYMIEPETGKDIVSTIDVFIQDITESALMKMMQKKNAEQGCAIVMETSTGKIKAIANLGKTGPATYWENLNYAVSPSEPGSTFKLVTLLALLEDKKINLNQSVFLENGVWQVAGNFVKDSEGHNENNVTIKKAFELSSNVAMAKLAYAHYSNNPRQFFKHIANLKLDTLTGIDLIGERRPSFHKPGTKLYNASTVPWMSFGYGIAISPLQTAMLYNAIANDGTMLKPYLVSSIKEEGLVLSEYSPKVVVSKICSDVTLKLLRTCLEGVCTDGTAKEVFKNVPYKVAGKTGTAKVADDNRGYTTNKYQSSFAGYFPADNPQYTCVVVIQNNPSEKDYYGATVAAPVFKEISDRLYSTYIKIAKNSYVQIKKKDSSNFQFSGYKADLAYLSTKMQIPFKDSTKGIDRWSFIQNNNENYLLQKKVISENAMPILKGLSLKDAVYLCEEKGLIVNVAGRGRLVSQSVLPGQAIAKGQLINLTFN